MWRLTVWAGLVILACGCTRQEQAQQQLITQLQAGIGGLRQYSDQRQEMVGEHYQQQRRLLDDAFDEDVRQRGQLDAPWIIEHRKGYVTGMEATWRAQQASEASHRQAMDNLLAVSDGLERLRWISEMRANWGKALGQITGEVQDAKH